MDVLIVDDDDKVRALFSRALRKAGYMVTAMDNGLAALAELQQHEYRAIVCDISMPFLEGRSFYHEMAKEYPAMAQRVVFATGLAATGEVASFLQGTGRPVLSKPVDLQDLVAAVRRVTDRGA